MEVVKIDSKDVIIALSCTNCFSIDGKEIAKNITSFYVHSDFLLLTTQQHTLICVPLNESGMEQLSKHDLTVKPWENGSNEISFTGESSHLCNPFHFMYIYTIPFSNFLTYRYRYLYQTSGERFLYNSSNISKLEDNFADA